MIDYKEFLISKHVVAKPSGFEPKNLNQSPFPFQQDMIAYACRQGRAGLWAQTGLGKTIMQLSWADQVYKHTNKDVLVLCPLAVAKQTAREAEKFQIETPVTVCRTQYGVKPGINVTNYQMLKHFDENLFSGVVVDESDVLADYTGVTKRLIISKFIDTPYKLDCSATPAPNNHMEIGNHADFLGVMPSSEMLSRWFINDTSHAGVYRLKDHGREDYWRWVASWACAVSKPSDLGYEDGLYALPPLIIKEHTVGVDIVDGREDGFLFRMPSMSATSMHKEMRRTVSDRVSKTLEIVYSIDSSEAVIIWCHTDIEANELAGRVPGSVEIRGSYSIEKKESRLEDFLMGNARILIAKPSMYGHGLNLQRCNNIIYVGLDYSFKGFYQSIRRCWRFGQTKSVNVHVIISETENRLVETLQRKQSQYDEMQAEMNNAILKYGLGATRRKGTLLDYNPDKEMIIPSWIGACS